MTPDQSSYLDKMVLMAEEMEDRRAVLAGKADAVPDSDRAAFHADLAAMAEGVRTVTAEARRLAGVPGPAWPAEQPALQRNWQALKDAYERALKRL